MTLKKVAIYLGFGTMCAFAGALASYIYTSPDNELIKKRLMAVCRNELSAEAAARNVVLPPKNKGVKLTFNLESGKCTARVPELDAEGNVVEDGVITEIEWTPNRGEHVPAGK